MTLPLFFIRHTPTGAYLPDTNADHRGATRVEPSTTLRPRVFRSRRDARIALTVWLKGELRFHRGDIYTTDDDLVLSPRPSRCEGDMEIVEIGVELP
jgi:hypothetical protein